MHRSTTPVLLVLLLASIPVAAILLAAPAHADGFLVPTRPNEPVRGQWAVTYHRVDIVVRGPHARVTVDQEFVNLGGRMLEAEYVFPLPKGAMVSSLTLFENGRGLEGRILRAEEARRMFEEIVRRQKDPALLEYLGNDFFRVRVFPIPAGGRRRVVLKYDQLLGSDGGTVELLYPLNTEKFSARPLEEVVVTVDLEADAPLGPIYSPSHDVAVVRPSPTKAKISYEANRITPYQDFLVYWSTTRNPVGASLLTYWPPDEQRGYFLFLASPVVGGRQEATRPKQITLVVDTSGSMQGDKIEQVRAALTQVIGGLNENDRFNVIAYHTGVVPLWDSNQPVTTANRKAALDYVATLRAQGGTNIKEALTYALSGSKSDGMTSVIMFLTDGRPTIGSTDTDEILKAVDTSNPRDRTRIFVFGVGVDVNTVLLDRLALENHGVPSFLRPGDDLELKVAALYEKVRYPVLTDLTFQCGGMQTTEILPGVIPDLFRGGQVVLAGRYGRGSRVEAVLAGQDGSVTREYHYVVNAGRKGEGLRSDFPARVWAIRRIGQLIDEIRLKKSPDQELVNEIVRLSTRFGILTEYTAFLADDTVDHTRVATNTARAGRILDHLAEREVGAEGFAQAANQGGRRGADRAPPSKSQRYWRADEGDRDVQEVVVTSVRQVGNRAFYRRGTVWMDSQLKDALSVDEVVTRWSPRFYALLRTTNVEENARLSQAGTLLLQVQGRVLRIIDES